MNPSDRETRTLKFKENDSIIGAQISNDTKGHPMDIKFIVINLDFFKFD
jgi:hypothetical protein